MNIKKVREHQTNIHYLIIIDHHLIELIFFRIIVKRSNINFPGSNCKCKDFINQNNVGNCKGKKPSQFQRKFFACYVDQPSSCTDLKDSGTNSGEQLSVNACLLRGRSFHYTSIKAQEFDLL